MKDTFERVEIKYVLSEEKYHAFRNRISEYMQDDEYGLSKISSIYYDSENLDVIRESLEKPTYKEKLRLRAYGNVDSNSTVFIELKKKYNGIVYKRRIPMKYSEALAYLNDHEYPREKSQIFNEIDYFVLFHDISRSTLIEYERIASYGKEDSDIRITYDKNINVSFNTVDFRTPGFKSPILGQGERLMEIKVPGAMPLWLANILSILEIYPVSFSKYGRASKNLLFNY